MSFFFFIHVWPFCVLLLFVSKGRTLFKFSLQTDASVDIKMSAWISIDDAFGRPAQAC